MNGEAGRHEEVDGSEVVELGRLRGFLAPLGATLVALVFVSTVVGMGVGRLAPHQVALDNLDPDRQAALAHRIVAVEQLLDGEGFSAAEARIGVLLGQSTVREGLDETVIGAEVGHRWLNLGASGGSFLQLRYYCRPLLASRLRPEQVVVGVHVQWLASPDIRAAAERVALDQSILDRLWFWRERNGMRNLAGIRLGAVRRQWLAAWDQPLVRQIVPGRGVGFEGDGPAGPDPWAAPRKYRTPRAPGHRIDGLLEQMAVYGWFDPAAYDLAGPEARALAGLLEGLGAFAPAVTVVLMPEEAGLRQAVPAAADDVFRAVVDEVAVRSRGASWLAVIDHRARMDDVDGVFFDSAHLNEQGRRLYSERLGRDLASRPHGYGNLGR